MISVVSEKTQSENGDCSLQSSPPKYKMRKVSAARDFPCGCGPNAAFINVHTEEVEGGCLRMLVDPPIDIRDGIQPQDCFNDVDGKGFLREGGSSQSQGTSDVCLEGWRKATHCLVRHKDREDKDEELGGKLVNFRSSGKSGELIFKNSKSLHSFNEKMVKSMLVNEIHNKSNEKALKDVVDPENTFDVGKSKMIEGSTLKLPLLPYHRTPSCLERREMAYPSPKCVSAVRDFPSGCGFNAQKNIEAKDKLLTHGDTDANTHKVVLRHSEHQAEEYIDAKFTYKDDVKEIISENNKAKCEGRSDEDSCGVIVMSSSQYDKYSETKVQEQVPEATTNDHCEGLKKKAFYYIENERNLEELGDKINAEITVYKKAEHEKSCSSIESLEKPMADLQNKEGRVIVLCLMSEINFSWRGGREAVKYRPSSSNAKRNKGNKQDYSDLDKYKCSSSTDKCEFSTVNLGESSTALVPFRNETDLSDLPSISRCKEGCFEDKESSNDFPSVPRKRDFEVSLPPLGGVSSSEKSPRAKVRETLRLFQAIFRKLQQGKQKDKGNANKRFDLQAAKILKEYGKYVNTGKKSIQGSVPGIEVGDVFHFRIELLIVGLHRQLQSGIDYLNLGDRTIATSIVASGGYANGVESSDLLIYTGQGGNGSGDKEPEDQKLERENLAMKNSIDVKNGVRVIRGFKEKKLADTGDTRHKSVATYTYDGLYTVEKYWHDIGRHRKLVYKFQLRRCPGQPELAWKEVTRSKNYKVREGRCVDDISDARETVPICAINTVDDENPPPLTYITKVMYPDWCQPIPPMGCDCKFGCSDSASCACASRNGGEIPYNDDGAIVEAKSLVYECGPSCKCPSTCFNRVSQSGVKFPLEIFKTESRGWGVRCLSSIPSGSFICEYIGELLGDKEAEQRTDNDEYLFDIGQNYNDPIWDGLSGVMPHVPTSFSDIVGNVSFAIDAEKYGNIGRFVNHSCSPNLYAQNVLYDHDDIRIPHIMLFAAENIPPLQELTYHYNYAADQILEPDGTVKKKRCYCGSPECSGWMY